MFLRHDDLKNYGSTENCTGCEAIQKGGSAVNHSEACRSRLSEALAQTPEGADRVKRTKVKIDEAIAEIIAKEDKNAAWDADMKADQAGAGSSSSGGLPDHARVPQDVDKTTPDDGPQEVAMVTEGNDMHWKASADHDPAATVYGSRSCHA